MPSRFFSLYLPCLVMTKSSHFVYVTERKNLQLCTKVIYLKLIKFKHFNQQAIQFLFFTLYRLKSCTRATFTVFILPLNHASVGTCQTNNSIFLANTCLSLTLCDSTMSVKTMHSFHLRASVLFALTSSFWCVLITELLYHCVSL